MISALLILVLAQAQPPPLSATIHKPPQQSQAVRPNPPSRPPSPPPQPSPPSHGRGLGSYSYGYSHGHHGHGYGGYWGSITVSPPPSIPSTTYHVAPEPAILIPTSEITNYGNESLADYARKRRLGQVTPKARIKLITE
jgi:hypothetical protein